ncbi:secretion protein HlyD [Thiomicrorhabdus immobilis]|uniref:Secretion protein HlyD n=1 Tax=Thiomicrorhabdus immobilis TaxID=2791037 RepID=A0ABM7MB09_9GAMM|nr:biotin/lipoyl-binding protein [Thiomicrorhabdus immobilis]BCN92499.1 secretion protein HlyD [Thiomicrorhabdus immobilis]
MFQKLKRRLIPVLIIAAAIVLFVYMKSTKPVQKPVNVQEKVWMVESMKAQFEDLSPVQTLYGKVESNALVAASAPVAGVIEQVLVKEGQNVVKGQALVAISQADLMIPLAQAKAEVANATAQLKLQKLTNEANQQRYEHESKVLKLKQVAVTRAQQLMSKNLASQSSVDAANEALVRQEYVVVGAKLAVQENQLKISQTQAALDKAKAALQQAELNVKRGQLIAPYDARIAQVNVSEGSRVNAGVVMVSFYALDSLELRAKLPVSQLPGVTKALQQNIPLHAYYQTADSEERFKLLRLAGEASTSGVDAFFALPKSLSELRPGELMEVNLKGVAQNNVVAVPYSAIYGSNRLYLIVDGRLQSHTVEMKGEVLRAGRLWALVKPDFAEGSKICLTHLPNATTGLKVSEVVQ